MNGLYSAVLALDARHSSVGLETNALAESKVLLVVVGRQLFHGLQGNGVDAVCTETLGGHCAVHGDGAAPRPPRRSCRRPRQPAQRGPVGPLLCPRKSSHRYTPAEAPPVPMNRVDRSLGRGTPCQTPVPEKPFQVGLGRDRVPTLESHAQLADHTDLVLDELGVQPMIGDPVSKLASRLRTSCRRRPWRSPARPDWRRRKGRPAPRRSRPPCSLRARAPARPAFPLAAHSRRGKPGSR